MITFLSCSNQGLEFEDNIDLTTRGFYTNLSIDSLLPEPGFLDGFRDSLHTLYSLDTLESTYCTTLVGVMDFIDDQMDSIIDVYNPLNMDCTECLVAIDGLEPDTLINDFKDFFDSLEINDIISAEENDIMKDFFDELNGENFDSINFSAYRDSIDLADTRGVISEKWAGLFPHIVLTLFEDNHNYYDDFEPIHEDDIQASWYDWRHVRKMLNPWGRIRNKVAAGWRDAMETAINHGDPESTQFGIDVWCSVVNGFGD